MEGNSITVRGLVTYEILISLQLHLNVGKGFPVLYAEGAEQRCENHCLIAEEHKQLAFGIYKAFLCSHIYRYLWTFWVFCGWTFFNLIFCCFKNSGFAGGDGRWLWSLQSSQSSGWLGHTGTVLNLLNTIKSEIELPLFGRGCTPADVFGQWFTLPMAEGAWARKKRTPALPAACPGSVHKLVWCLAAAQQCGGKGGHLPKGMPRYLLLGQQSPGSFCPVPAPGWGQIFLCAGCHLALLQKQHSSTDMEGSSQRAAAAAAAAVLRGWKAQCKS